MWPLCATASLPHRDTLGTGSRTYFVENRGQWDARVLFEAQMHNAALFAEEHTLTIALREQPEPQEGEHFHHAHGKRMHAYRIHFDGASTNTTVHGRDNDPEGGYDNYYYGKDPSQWTSGLPHYMTVYYSDLYPGIDMDVQVAEHAMKSNFYVSAGTDPSVIRLRYEGVDRLYLSNGNLIVRTTVRDIVELRPYAYQETEKGREEVSARFVVKGDEVHFALGDYDATQPLVIDPILYFSTYTGSTADNWGTTATYDMYKNTYTAGLVFNIGYPVTAGAYDQTFNNNADIGIFKFDTTGSRRLFATYLGGQNADMPHSMYVNSFDELVIFGTTGSANFPVTADAYDTSFNGGWRLLFENSGDIIFPNGSDIFVSRFNSTGTELQASTYVGGNDNDGLNYRQSYNRNYSIIMQGNDSLYFNYGDGARGELITDDMNNVYVGSTTFSENFPTSSRCVQSQLRGRQEGVAFKLDYNLQNLIWSTYLGGEQDDAVYSIDVDTQYNLLVCGGTSSTDFPTTPGAYQTTYNGGTTDGFVSKISTNGTRLIASTYYGSDAYDQCYFVRTGRQNEVYLYGQTKASGSTMVHNASYNVPGSGMMVAELSPELESRQWATVFGTPMGRPNLSPTAFAADICNRVYCVGWGRDFVGYNSIDWGTAGTTGMETSSGAWSIATDGQDFYILCLGAGASSLDYATFFGEMHSSGGGGKDHVDGGTSRFDKMGTLYQSVCASCGGYSGFPTTPNAWSSTNNSDNCNNALFRMNIHDDFAVADFAEPTVGCAPYAVQFVNTGRGDSFQWDFGDGSTSTLKSPTHTYTEPGQYTVCLIAHLSYGCRQTDTMTHTVHVLGNTENKLYRQANCSGETLQIGFRPRLGATYRWISGNVSDSTVSNPYVSRGGVYVLRIESEQGCSEIDTFVVTYLSMLDTLIVRNPTCPGGNDGSVTARLLPEYIDSVTFLWDNVEGDSTLTDLRADGYTHVLRISSTNCETTHFFTLHDPEVLTVEKEAEKILCNDSCEGWIHLRYGYAEYDVGDTVLEHLCEGIYILDYTDTAGCPYSDTTVLIRDHSLDSLKVWADDTFLYLNESTRLHATQVGAAHYSWSNAHTLDYATVANPLATPVDTVTIYTVTVTDSLGCTRQGSVTVHCTDVNCGRPNIFIPNAFSPNGDGINDELCFRGNYVLEFHLTIFTRWGEKVFETNDIHTCWDGRYNNNWCQPGVYTFTCQVRCEANLESLIKGDITLIR